MVHRLFISPRSADHSGSVSRPKRLAPDDVLGADRVVPDIGRATSPQESSVASAGPAAVASGGLLAWITVKGSKTT